MTNEQLVAQIQSGDNTAALILWEQTYKLVYKYMRQYFPLCHKYGIEEEDLKQSGYIAMMEAAKEYDPARNASFSNYLRFNVMRVSRNALGLNKRQEQRKIVSLDAPFTRDTEDLTLHDAVEDRSATETFESLEDRLFNQQLHDVLEMCLSTLGAQEQVFLRQHYYQEKAVRQIAEAYDIPYERVRSILSTALRAVRTKHCQKLWEFREEIINCYGYRGTGWTSFRDSGASCVERTAERVEDEKRKALEYIKAMYGFTGVINMQELYSISAAKQS